jgi:hypothetical protein
MLIGGFLMLLVRSITLIAGYLTIVEGLPLAVAGLDG